ncbi:MAG: hypothetical protein CYPHOPRED_002749, partial [Cyphobasidiales sp. Tagirdzhanova-0007]
SSLLKHWQQAWSTGAIHPPSTGSPIGSARRSSSPELLLAVWRSPSSVMAAAASDQSQLDSPILCRTEEWPYGGPVKRKAENDLIGVSMSAIYILYSQQSSSFQSYYTDMSRDTQSQRSLTALSGSWTMNRDLSSNVESVLELQGFNVVTRKAASAAPISLAITQKGREEVYIDQSTSSVLPSIKEEWYLDWSDREQNDSFLGKVKSRSHWIKAGELGDDGFLGSGVSGEEELIEALVESLENGWRARQVWCFEEDKFVRRVRVTKDDRIVECRLVYEYAG